MCYCDIFVLIVLIIFVLYDYFVHHLDGTVKAGYEWYILKINKQIIHKPDLPDDLHVWI